MKPGWQTTEFWLTLAAIILGTLAASGVLASGSPWAKVVGVLGDILASLGYTYSRSMVKVAHAEAANDVNPTAAGAKG